MLDRSEPSTFEVRLSSFEYRIKAAVLFLHLHCFVYIFLVCHPLAFAFELSPSSRFFLRYLLAPLRNFLA